MTVFFDGGQFGFLKPDGAICTFRKVWKMEIATLCCECGEPIKKGDFIIYEDSFDRKAPRKWYHEYHSPDSVKGLYAWAWKDFPAEDQPK